MTDPLDPTPSADQMDRHLCALYTVHGLPPPRYLHSWRCVGVVCLGSLAGGTSLALLLWWFPYVSSLALLVLSGALVLWTVGAGVTSLRARPPDDTWQP